MSSLFSVDGLLNNLKIIRSNCPQDIELTGVAIDDRLTLEGNIFFALQGQKVDGHCFIEKAFENGAKLCVIDHITPNILEKKYPYLLVENTLESLFRLARYCRENLQGKVIALTGSAGKSTTKNWLGEIFTHFGNTHSTFKNQNTDIGVALTLTNCDKKVDFCIIELGMNSKGEISKASKVAKPDIALITNVKPVHIENFESIMEIAYEKSDIVDGLNNNAVVFINKDETPFEEVCKYIKNKNKNIKILSYGYNDADCQIKLSSFINNEFFIEASIFGTDIKYSIPNVGKHFILNTIAIIGIAKYMNILEKDVTKFLKNITLYHGAGKVYDLQTVKGRIKVIDETYNANPVAVICAIEKLAVMDGKRKIAILGDMYELGEYLQEGYNKILQALIDNKIDLVFTCGENIKYLFDKLPLKIKGAHTNDVDTKIIENIVKDGDVFLVKGSHGLNYKKGRMYAFVEFFISYFSKFV